MRVGFGGSTVKFFRTSCWDFMAFGKRSAQTPCLGAYGVLRAVIERKRRGIYDALAEQLMAAGVTLGMDAVKSLVAGVTGAPDGSRPDAWVDLIAPRADQTLRAQLLALKGSMARKAPADPVPAERLSLLRDELSRCGLDGFVVPRTDEHQGEYVPPRADRLRWLTGFSGSAGVAVILMDRAAIFVDGRYTLQVRAQVDTVVLEPHHLTEMPPGKWIAANLPLGGKLGYDPWLHAENAVVTLRVAAERAGGFLTLLNIQEKQPWKSVRRLGQH